MCYCRAVSLFVLFFEGMGELIGVWYRGVYVPNDDRWPVHFRGMGIRIEDSICVGEEHPIVLSAEAAKEVSR